MEKEQPSGSLVGEWSSPAEKSAYRTRLEQAFQACRTQLLQQRNDQGHWEGELSTSALSTATAVMALHQVLKHQTQTGKTETTTAQSSGQLTSLISGGLHWLLTHRNPDGGWGDTTKSVSNISTTMLVRAVFAATQQRYGSVSDYDPQFLQLTDAYIKKIGGIAAVKRRYGQDKTFSVPILMQCALGGIAEWSELAQLPFEMACLPADWYKWAQLPVVSYALPALITIGLVKHRKQPTPFWPWRIVRNRATASSLRVLTRIQPTTGGFLEAAPLTSFVTMSLVEAGEGDHPVVQNAVRFLTHSVREDGSWPIDTNLATWVSTLSVNALGENLPSEQVQPLLDWLLGQQYRTVHPYTNADPGGWAWTNLPGGVPDADDTPGAILAILKLRERCQESTRQDIEAACRRAVHWLLSLQNRDGGWPTFCRGWGKLPFDRSSADITAHGLRALQAYRDTVSPSANEEATLTRAMRRGFQYLARKQRPDGAWLPLWFGNQFAHDDENPVYGTARVLLAYPAPENRNHAEEARCSRAEQFLTSIQNADGGWGGAADIASSVEETALAVEALIHVGSDPALIRRGITWLIERVEQETINQPTPIGFYFAKLWYFEKLYSLIFATATLRKAREWEAAQDE